MPSGAVLKAERMRRAATHKQMTAAAKICTPVPTSSASGHCCDRTAGDWATPPAVTRADAGAKRASFPRYAPLLPDGVKTWVKMFGEAQAQAHRSSSSMRCCASAIHRERGTFPTSTSPSWLAMHGTAHAADYRHGTFVTRGRRFKLQRLAHKRGSVALFGSHASAQVC
jgi:hypothetical protein